VQRQRGTGNRGAGGDAEVAETDQVLDDVAAAARGLVQAHRVAVEVGETVPAGELGVLRGNARVGGPGVAVDALLKRRGDGAGRVVIDDGQCGRGLAAERGAAGRAAERQVDGLVAFHERIVGDGNRERLAGVADGEIERAAARGVVAAG